MPQVTSAQNPRLREALRLAQSSRDRRKAGRCILEGEHLVAVYLERSGRPETLIVEAERAADPRIARLVAPMSPGDVLVVPRRIFAEISTLPPEVGVLAVVQTPHATPTAPADFCLLLEDLQDPGNVGTILRTAAAAGVGQVHLSKLCAFAWSPKVLRAAQGAHFLTTIVEDVDLPAWATAFRAGGGRVLALDPRGATDLYASRLQRPIAIAVGNEGTGLSPALVNAADERVAIPMPGGAESLNAAAATAVALFECLRQRRSEGLVAPLRHSGSTIA